MEGTELCRTGSTCLAGGSGERALCAGVREGALVTRQLFQAPLKGLMAFTCAASGMRTECALPQQASIRGSRVFCLLMVPDDPGNHGRRCARRGRVRTTRRPRPIGSSTQPTAPAASPAPRRRRARARRCSRRAWSRARGLAAAPSASLNPCGTPTRGT